jgi:chromosome segregation ATPase
LKKEIADKNQSLESQKNEMDKISKLLKNKLTSENEKNQKISELENNISKLKKQIDNNKPNEINEYELSQLQEALLNKDSVIENYKKEIERFEHKLTEKDTIIQENHIQTERLQKELANRESYSDILNIDYGEIPFDMKEFILKLQYIVLLLHDVLKDDEIKEEAGDPIRITRDRLLDLSVKAMELEHSTGSLLIDAFKKEFENIKFSRIDEIHNYLKDKDIDKVKTIADQLIQYI